MNFAPLEAIPLLRGQACPPSTFRPAVFVPITALSVARGGAAVFKKCAQSHPIGRGKGA